MQLRDYEERGDVVCDEVGRASEIRVSQMDINRRLSHKYSISKTKNGVNEERQEQNIGARDSNRMQNREKTEMVMARGEYVAQIDGDDFFSLNTNEGPNMLFNKSGNDQQRRQQKVYPRKRTQREMVEFHAQTDNVDDERV